MIDIWTNARSHSDKHDIYVFAIWSKVTFTQMCHLSICYIFITVLMNSKLSYFPHGSQNSLPIYLELSVFSKFCNTVQMSDKLII